MGSTGVEVMPPPNPAPCGHTSRRPSTLGRVRARVLGVLLLATLVGVGGGLGVGYLRQPQPASGGTATPAARRLAQRAGRPADDRGAVRGGHRLPTPDPGLSFRPLPMSNSSQTWRVPVPAGLGGVRRADTEPVPRKQCSEYDELRFRPADEPTSGGYSLRVKTDQQPRAARARWSRQRLAASARPTPR